MTDLQAVIGAMHASQATGCAGAGGYLAYANDLGYERVEVLDWTSSAGDWSFLISKDGLEWRILWQENNWPRAGFSYSISDTAFYGTVEQVYEELEAWEGVPIE